ncbi:MAG TPA: DUF5666 domain-containing protein, partial [Burkholderiaceae bacterium]|nr:DUF5666 domain-containing protein [Burkholderiaceae bacterium]
SGCGGGVETGGTGASNTYAEGPITGFGSVIVNGVRFDDRSADVEDVVDGAKTRSDLKLGMVIEVDAGRVSDDGLGNRSATASSVRINPHLVGPVTALDLVNGRLFVLGLPVRLTSATVLEGLANGVSSLALGQIVEVHGFFEPMMMSMGYVATRLERRSAALAYRVRGMAHAVDGGAKTLQIGDQVFDLADTGMPGGLNNGGFVRLVVRTDQVEGRWRVLRAALETRRLADRDEAELEGVITTFTSNASFAVNGITVDASSASRPASGLGTGVRVKVRGRAMGGLVVASSVELHSDDDAYSEGIDLRGVVSGLDIAAKTFVMRGVSVFYGGDPAPQFEGGSAANLANNLCLRVRGVLDAGRTRLLATRIEFGESCQ